MQLNHESVPFRNQEFPIILVCDTILFQPNIGSVFRISEAFGVEKNSGQSDCLFWRGGDW